MKIYLDIFNQEEIVSDSFNLEEKFNGVVAEVDSRYIVKGAVQVDIGQGNAFGGQGEEDEGVDDQEEKVNNIIEAFKYAETQFAKADFTTYFKGYMKKLKSHLEANKPDRVKDFLEGAQQYFKWVLSRFDDFQFYCTESYDMENHITLAYYKEGKETPTFVYLLDGLKEVKM